MNQEPAADGAELQILDDWMNKYGRDVLNFAFSYVHNYHQAEDITQEVFLRAFSKRDSFRGTSSLRTWLLSITANRCKDYLRSWSHRKMVHDEEGIKQMSSPAFVEQTVVESMERNAVWSAVNQLPVKYREVIILYYQRDLSGQEIAQVLGVSEQNVRTRLHRGRTLLKEILGERVGES